MRKKLLLGSVFLALLEMISPGCKTQEPEKPILEPLKKVELKEEKPKEEPKSKQTLENVTLEDALNNPNVRQKHIDQMPLSGYISEAFYYDTPESQKELFSEFKKLYNPTRQDALILYSILGGTNFKAITILPTPLTGTGKKSVVAVFPRFYRSVNTQGEAELILIDQLGSHARDNTNGIILGDDVFVPEMSIAEEAPKGKRLVKINNDLYSKVQDLRAAYAMIEGVKSGKRDITEHCKKCILKEYAEKFFSVKMTAMLRAKEQGGPDVLTDFMGRALHECKWYPVISGKTIYLEKRE